MIAKSPMEASLFLIIVSGLFIAGIINTFFVTKKEKKRIKSMIKTCRSSEDFYAIQRTCRNKFSRKLFIKIVKSLSLKDLSIDAVGLMALFDKHNNLQNVISKTLIDLNHEKEANSSLIEMNSELNSQTVHLKNEINILRNIIRNTQNYHIQKLEKTVKKGKKQIRTTQAKRRSNRVLQRGKVSK